MTHNRKRIIKIKNNCNTNYRMHVLFFNMCSFFQYSSDNKRLQDTLAVMPREIYILQN